MRAADVGQRGTWRLPSESSWWRELLAELSWQARACGLAILLALAIVSAGVEWRWNRRGTW